MSRFLKWNTNVLSFNIEVFQGKKEFTFMSKWLREKGLPGLDFKFNYWSITEKARVVVWPFTKKCGDHN